MEYEYTKKFNRDLQRCKNKGELIRVIGRKVQHIAKAGSLKKIYELVPIRKTKAHYRIKIKLSENEIYRIGVVVVRKTIWFVCIESDKKRFYKGFP